MRADASGYSKDMPETPERDPEDRLHDDEIDQLPEGFVPDPLNELDGPEESPRTCRAAPRTTTSRPRTTSRILRCRRALSVCWGAFGGIGEGQLRLGRAAGAPAAARSLADNGVVAVLPPCVGDLPRAGWAAPTNVNCGWVGRLVHRRGRGPGNVPVRRYARQFIEQYMGPADLAAVLSPGGVPSATEDFTSDKARLLAAIDHFTGTKLRSATVEREEESRLFYDGVPMHGGKDPEDGERANRASSLNSTLEAIARHAERIEGRARHCSSSARVSTTTHQTSWASPSAMPRRSRVRWAGPPAR